LVYVDEELIKVIGHSTEKSLKTLEENLEYLRFCRVQILQKENQVMIQVKILQKDQNLLSFNPKKKVKFLIFPLQFFIYCKIFLYY